MKNIVLALLFLCSLSLSANELVTSIPFKIHRGHIYIKGQINGSRDVNIVFDTGAAVNVANTGLSNEIEFKSKATTMANGANGLVKMEFSKGNELIIGSVIRMRRQDFYLADISHLQDFDLPVDAIVGGTLLNEYVVELDFDKQVINLYEFSDFDQPNGFRKTPFDLRSYSIPQMDATIELSNGETYTGSYLIDSGAGLAISLNSPFVESYDLLTKVSPNYEYLGKALGNESMEYIGRVSKLKFLGEDFEGVPSRMSTTKEGVSSYSAIDGLIGLEVLKRFNLIYNYRERKLYSRVNGNDEKPFRVNNYGLNMIKKDGYFLINQVIPKSAADKAKLQAGDKILSVDGNQNLTHDQFEDYVKNKKEIQIMVDRNSKILNVKLLPFQMI